jgi:ankyrin repeat protein
LHVGAVQHGMTPLQHAAYKGHRELCEILLNHGADVNANSHEHGYTSLMFAALSGKSVCIYDHNSFCRLTDEYFYSTWRC